MVCNKSRPPFTRSSIVFIHVSFSYAATYRNEDSAGGGDFAEQLSLLIFFFFKSKFAFLEHRDVASTKS